MKPVIRRFLKRSYQALPFKHAVFQLWRFFGVPNFALRKQLGFTGIIPMSLPDGQFIRMKNYDYDYLTDFFWQKGVSDWEEKSRDIWFDLAKNAKTILDIGANLGVYALYAAKANPSATVIAFEPQPNIYNRLMENIALNQSNIVAEVLALSDTNGQAFFYNRGNDPFTINTTSGTLNPNFSPKKQDTIQVECLTLATYIENKGLPKVDLMKIDVESFEAQVLSGMGKYLALYKPQILIEILNAQLGADIEPFFEGLGYNFFCINEKTGLQRIENLRNEQTGNYLLLPA